MSNNLSKVFKDAKKFLWDGESSLWHNDNKEEYICHAIERTAHSKVDQGAATDVVMSRLDFATSDYPHTVTVETYLIYVVGVSKKEVFYDQPRVQKYRKDWLTSLENEFKPKLAPKKGFSVHHIDGNLNNNDLGNMTYVETKVKINSNNFIEFQ